MHDALLARMPSREAEGVAAEGTALVADGALVGTGGEGAGSLVAWEAGGGAADLAEGSLLSLSWMLCTSDRISSIDS